MKSWKILLLSVIACISAQFAYAQAPIIDEGQPANSVVKPERGAAANNSSATGDLLIQLQSLQQEVMDLRGIVEEQHHQIETMKKQERDSYNDLDERIGERALGGATAPAQTAPIDPGATLAVAAPALMETARPEEYEAYQIAYAKLKGQDFNGAIKAFTAFLASYPNSLHAPNSYYWLGKAYLLIQPQNLSKAQQSFAKVGEYPHSSKVPDALYELGKVYFLKGDKAKAKAMLQQVINNYSASGSSAPQLAKQFLDQNLSVARH